jgi:ribosomal protein L11 methyltransferase
VIEPGRAFGTGAHPTTRLCMELLAALPDEEAGGPLTDLGTGSGVLAIAAAKLGWAPVRAFDHEPASIEAARENAEANGVMLELGRVNLRQQMPELAPTVVANLTAPLLREVAGSLGEGRMPRRLVCSGLLATEAAEVSAAFSASGMREEGRLEEGDWAALSLSSR